MRSRRRCCGRGAAAPRSTRTPAFGPGCTGSPPTTAWTCCAGASAARRPSAPTRRSRGCSPIRTACSTRSPPPPPTSPTSWRWRARRSSSRSSPSCRSCPHASAPRCSCATCWGGQRGRPPSCSRPVCPPPTARCSGRARPSPTGAPRTRAEAGSSTAAGHRTPPTPRERELVQALIDIHEGADADRAAELLAQDVRVTMPPNPFLYEGREAVLALFEFGTGYNGPGEWRLVRTARQPPAGHRELSAGVGRHRVPRLQDRCVRHPRRARRRDHHVRQRAVRGVRAAPDVGGRA